MTAVQWSGQTWDVRTWNGGPSRDGLWSDKNVSVDSNGRLHLKITKRADGKFVSAEIDSRQVGWGYGSYRMVTLGSLAALPKGAVFGLFTYGPGVDASNREIDFEASAWGSNEVRWDHTYYSPDGSYNVISRTPVNKSKRFIHELVWLPNRLQLSTTDDTGRTVLSTATSNVPVPGEELVLMNLWVYDRTKVAPCEVVVESFKFIKASASQL